MFHDEILNLNLLDNFSGTAEQVDESTLLVLDPYRELLISTDGSGRS